MSDDQRRPPTLEEFQETLHSFDQIDGFFTKLVNSADDFKTKLREMRIFVSAVAATPLSMEEQVSQAAPTENGRSPHAAISSSGGDCVPEIRRHYDTWDEYRDNGIYVPAICPASPDELRAVMADHPMPKAPKPTDEWEIRRVRNLAAAQLMAERLPDARFKLTDFSELMRAAGMHDSSVDAVKKTLKRHLILSPDFQEVEGSPGEWQWVALSEGKAAENDNVASTVRQPGAESQAPTAARDVAVPAG